MSRTRRLRVPADPRGVAEPWDWRKSAIIDRMIRGELTQDQAQRELAAGAHDSSGS